MSITKFNDPALLTNAFEVNTKAYYVKNWQQHDGFFHYHNHIEIMYVISGRCQIVFKDNTSDLKAGDYILINSHVDHSLKVIGKCRMINYEFCFFQRSEAAVPMALLLSSSQNYKYLTNIKVPYVHLRDDDQIKFLLKRILLLHQRDEVDNDVRVQILMAELLMVIGKELKIHLDNKDHNAVLYSRKAAEYIETHYDTAILIEDVAKVVGVHENYLQRVFKASYETTIIDYLTRVRMEKAKMLLLNTGLTVSEIPEYIGLNSVQYFIKLFKRDTGKTPLKFRKENDRDYKVANYNETTMKSK